MRSGSFLFLVALLVSLTLVAGDGVKEEKEGVCPPDNIRCITSKPPHCNRDSDCPKQKKCCYLRCGFRCVPPVRTLEDGVPAPPS